MKEKIGHALDSIYGFGRNDKGGTVGDPPEVGHGADNQGGEAPGGGV